MLTAAYKTFADALPEVIVILNAKGDIQFINKFGREFLRTVFHQIDDKNNLAEFLETPPEELSRTYRAWSRTREPMPAAVKWRQEKDIEITPQWRCQGFMLEPATADKSALLILRCLPGRGQQSEFSILNQELEHTQNALKKLQRARDDFERLYEQAAVTLESIGDGVITTDINGMIESINPVAEALTGWLEADAVGQPSETVFNIIDEISRKPVPNPVIDAIENNRVIELNNHTILIARDGREHIIEDSVAPIRHHDDSLLGAVLVFHDVTNDRLARRQLEYLAQHDMLTSLHNRHYFEQEVTKAVEVANRGQIKSAILYIDLDEFKQVNDTAGHAVGDSLLTQIAELFSSRLRRGDILSRLGGDEFGVLLQNIKKNELETIARSYKDALSNFVFTWKENRYDIHASIGIAIIDKHMNTTAEAFRQADIACYSAKQAGRNRFHIFDKSLDTDSRQIGEMELLKKLNHALDNDGFQLLYQPIADGTGKNLNYYEVLIRLEADGETLPPSMFIPVAERFGMMPKIDLWVIQQTLKQIKDGQYQDHMFSINLSGTSLDAPEISDFLLQALGQAPELAQSFMLEITETSAVSHIEKAAEFVRQLKRYGVSFALDDFGTGFSSFAYLKHLPVDIVKIDGLFVRDITIDPADLAMVRSINHIAHSLDKKTVAEYVESAEIQTLLEEIGVDYLQGYHIGKPAALPAASNIATNSS